MSLRMTNPPQPIIYPKLSDQNFEIAILFNVVERVANNVFEDENPTQPSGLRVLVLPWGHIIFFIENFVVEATKGFIRFEIERASVLFNCRK